MTRPTRRGVTLLGVALVTYLTARMLGTWELYLVALAFVGMTGVAWVLVQTGSQDLSVDRRPNPDEPVAGDPLEFSFTVGSRRRLPGLHIFIVDATGGADGFPGAVVVDDAGLLPRRRVTSGPRPARRGVYRLPEFSAIVEDPLGLARRRRTCGEPLRLTVAARVEELSSCPLCAESGARDGGGHRRLPTRNAWEFHGIRPHVPGEPLNRVDWKSTAKTGALMLRETEADTDQNVTVVLDGQDEVAGPASPAGSGPSREDAAFETAVVAAGSMVAFTLLSGHAVSLLLPDEGWRDLRLAPGAASRRRLPAALAETRPRSRFLTGSSLAAILSGKQGRRRVLVLVTSRMDDDLVRGLAKIHRQGAAVSVVHVACGLPVAPGATPGGLTEAGWTTALAAAGIRYVRVRPGEDLRLALSRPDGGRVPAGRRLRRPSQRAGVWAGSP
jgi:uncharacterized protein (DUF58 family)